MPVIKYESLATTSSLYTNQELKSVDIPSSIQIFTLVKCDNSPWILKRPDQIRKKLQTNFLKASTTLN